MHPNIHVREIIPTDINLLADYWLGASDDFLLGMGVDLALRPTRRMIVDLLEKQICTPLQQKQSYALIWEIDGHPSGHTNVNKIEFGYQAFMHLHLWYPGNRQKGFGAELVRGALPFFFEKLQLQKLCCEPYALNPAPNKTLRKAGFTFIRKYRTKPGYINFEQEVNRWEMSRETYEKMRKQSPGE